MNKPIDANALRERIEGLYQGVDLTQDDKKILINEQRSISMYEFRESQSEHDKANFSKTMSEVAAERNQDPTYKENHLNGVRQKRDNTYQVETNARPEVKAKISKAMKGKQKSQDHLDKVAAKNKERAKTIITPWGEFPSRKAAVFWAQENTDIVNVDKKIQAWVKKPNSGFYYKDTE